MRIIQSSNSTSSNYLKKIVMDILADLFTRMFIALSFIIAKSWKPPKSPKMGNRLNKLWHIQPCTEEYTSTKNYAIEPYFIMRKISQDMLRLLNLYV